MPLSLITLIGLHLILLHIALQIYTKSMNNENICKFKLNDKECKVEGN